MFVRFFLVRRHSGGEGFHSKPDLLSFLGREGRKGNIYIYLFDLLNIVHRNFDSASYIAMIFGIIIIIIYLNIVHILLVMFYLFLLFIYSFYCMIITLSTV